MLFGFGLHVLDEVRHCANCANRGQRVFRALAVVSSTPFAGLKDFLIGHSVVEDLGLTVNNV